ncbi:MAG: hypothetical protein QOF77_828 [Solirubrobacteraceae bacterium]|jgi:hypothetical protein|nr:hypothetical protein [Solirubrobacteraceae bacterium]
MADPLRLAMMTFPQHWDGAGTLTLSVLLIPSADPLAEPLIGLDPATPTFARGAPSFTVLVDPGLAALPSTAAAFALVPSVTSPAPAPAATFDLLAGAVTTAGARLAPPAVAAPTPRIRKALPPTYLAAGGNPPDGDLTTTDDDFGCAMREATWEQPPPAGTPSVSWGEVISYALRQPVLATRLGLRYELAVTLDAARADALAAGGYLFAALHAGDPWAKAAAANPGALRLHAARIPPLAATPRPVFAAVQFAVDRPATAPTDDAVAAAEAYADGFAKLVHTTQPTNAEATVADGSLAPASDLGIQIGWDDEQVVTWHNDQLALLDQRGAGTLDQARETPLGVLGYRVDVAEVTPATPGDPPRAPVWESLVAVTGMLPAALGRFTGELTVEPVATRPRTTAPADAWLPRYFANWRGGSLCEPDSIPRALTARQEPPAPTRTAAGLTTLLSYGRTYAFRVRLADLSSGGPGPRGEDPVDPPPNASATQTFQRLVPPKSPTVVQAPAPAAAAGRPDSLIVTRPMIGYPEVLYTHLGDTEAARGQIRDHLVNHATTHQAGTAGLPDPDVDAVDIEVSVRHPLHDVAGEGSLFQTLYRTSRPLVAPAGEAPLVSDPGTEIALSYLEAPSILGWPAAGPATGPLPIPRGRDVRITLRARLRAAEPDYFGEQAQVAMASTIAVRAEPAQEPPLLGRADAAPTIRGFLLRRPPDVVAPGLVAQLAEELGVAANGESLTSPPGRRVVFGASRGLRHTVSADGETLTLAASSELVRNWVVAIVLDVERDWTWDGLEPSGFTVLRGAPGDSEVAATAVGAIAVPRVLGAAATTHPSRQERARTRLVFLDAVDPHEPVAGGFPQSIEHRWFLAPERTPAGPPGAAPPAGGQELADSPLDLRLPIAIPPTQVPQLASVGLALSAYRPGPGYASTEPRTRALWVELTEPIANHAGDALFARVLAHGADPLLYRARPQVVGDVNPPLALDPELVRVALPEDTDDRAGEAAMTRLVPSPDSDRHFLLPLPAGIGADDPELFGFYSYEFRVGHSGAPGDLRWWSTANARFGSPLRVVGVQHPPPALVCHAGRYGHQQVQARPMLEQLRQGAGARFAIDPSVLAALTTTLPPAHELPIALTEGPPSLIVATAPYATPVLDGQSLVDLDEEPRTTMWFFVYAQAVQADGASMRNILLATAPGVFRSRRRAEFTRAAGAVFADFRAGRGQRDRLAFAVFHQAELETLLTRLHLPDSAPLSVLAVELLPAGTVAEPNLSDFGVASTLVSQGRAADRGAGPEPPSFPFGRILRTSPLTPIEPFC